MSFCSGGGRTCGLHGKMWSIWTSFVAAGNTLLLPVEGRKLCLRRFPHVLRGERRWRNEISEGFGAARESAIFCRKVVPQPTCIVQPNP